MPTPRSLLKGTHRDVTKALRIAETLDAAKGASKLEDYRTETHELVVILRAIDARTGRRDPSQRTTKKPAKKTVKTVRARR